MKKSLLLSLALGLVMMAQAKVAFLVPAGNTDMNSLPVEYYNAMDAGIPRQHEQSPERRAWIWFNEWYVTANMGRFICFNDLANIPSDVHAIWIYVDRVDFGTAAFDALFADYIDELQAFVNNGGSIFLCKQATRLEKDLVGATMANNEVIVPDYNDGGYSSEVYDSLVHDAEFGAGVSDANMRWSLFLEAEKQLIVEDAAVVPVFQAGGAMIISPKISGIEFHSAAVDSYRHIVVK